MPLPRTERYSAVAVAFHWAIAGMVVANLAIGLLQESVLKGTMPLHKSIGLTVLILSVARVAWRLAHRPPPLPADTRVWERGAAHATHWGLYALMLAMPLTGWMLVSGGPVPRPLVWFGLVDVPLLPVGTATSEVAYSAHGLLGWVMLALVALHVVAALRHHLILRDHVLTRMLPFLGGTHK